MKFLIAIALALGISAVAYAAAAQLNVNGGVIQYGEDTQLQCDQDGVQVYWSTNGADVDHVTIAGISGNCVGTDIGIVITGSGNSVLYTSPFQNHSVDGNEVFNIPAGVHSVDVTDIHITIRGGGTSP
jgi:hypothetical protein